MKFNYLTILLSIVFLQLSFAQADLHVSNDSYIFVDGDGFTSGTDVAPLFVTNDISLSNTGLIYLRDEAQLLQGDEASRNFGLGNISIYQKGTVNKWAYNYWCSPVGSPTAAAVNDNFSASTMQESTGLTSSQNFDFSPTSQYDGDDTTDPVQIASSWFYKFETSDEYSEWVQVGNSGNAAPGLGFTMKGTNATSSGFDPDTQGQQIDFRGKPNTGTIDVTTSAPVSGDAQWTLTGNPYPSALDMRDLLWDTDNLGGDNDATDGDEITTGALYYWDQEPSDDSHYIEDYNGGYASVTINSAGDMISYTPATYKMYDGSGNILGGPGSTSGKPSPQRYIPVGQGFMVEGKAGGDFKIKNSHRTFYKQAGSQSIFFQANNESDGNKSNNDNSNGNTNVVYDEIPEGYKRFRLFVEFNGLYTRELLQNFHATATNGFDYGLEAKSPEGVGSDASWTLNDEAYVIQAHDFNENLKIPLVIKLQENQPLNFRLGDIQHFDESQEIYFHDLETDTYFNLRENNLDMVLEAGNYTNRFEITFNKESLSLTEEELNNFTVFQNNNTNNLTIVNPNSLTIKSVNFIDVSGKQIFNKTNLPLQTRHEFSTQNLSDGVYITTITLDNNQALTQKVIVKNKR